MTSPPQIPVDLYRQIFRESVLDQQDLLNLCLASRALSFEAYHALYRNIIFRHPISARMAIETLTGSLELAGLVHDLTIRIPAPFTTFYRTQLPNLIKTINSMTNLQSLTLDYPWGNSGLSTTGLWTRHLRLHSRIETISIETQTYNGVHELFMSLPKPLRRYVNIQPIHTRVLEGVTQVFCNGVYGQWTPLPDLESLILWNLNAPPTGQFDAPKLHTLAIVGPLAGLSSVPLLYWDKWSPLVPGLKKVKRLGPLSYETFADPFISGISKLPTLEVILLVLQSAQYHDFGDFEAERLGQALPQLRQVIIARGYPERQISKIKTWSRTPGHSQDPSTLQRTDAGWTVTSQHRGYLWTAFSMLVEDIPPHVQHYEYWKRLLF